MSTHLEGSGQAAQVRSTLDFEGTLGAVEVSSLGVERASFERRDGGWTPSSGLAPRLAAVVAALEARRRALETGDAEQLASLAVSPEVGRKAKEGDLLRRLSSGYRVCAWYIRLERNRAAATERYEAGPPSAPEKATTSLTLELRGSQFLFSGSLL